MKLIKELFEKYKDIILYVFFGGCTTVINVITYFLCFNLMHIPNVVSTAIAWVIAVAFAFITNKLFVFDSKSFEKSIIIHEILTFFGSRVATGVLEVGIMFVAVDMLHWNALIWKILCNIIVIILNYVASKLIIFKKK